MVKLHLSPQAQTSRLLLLPAEVRTKIWCLLFADSKIVYNKCAYDRDLTTERYQITQTCRFAYLDAFNLLWSNTTIKYIGCVPTSKTASLKEQFAASVACRKLVPRLELELLDNRRSWQVQRNLDLTGLRYFAPLKELLIGPICLEYRMLSSIPALNYQLNYLNADNVGSDEILLQIINSWMSPSNSWSTSKYELGHGLLALLRRRDRKYMVFLRLLVTFHAPVPVLLDKRIHITIDYDNKDGKKLIRSGSPGSSPP